MSLVLTIETLQKRPLTPSEVSTLNEFQRSFKIDDDDPLIVVLALMARSQLIIDSAPNLLQQKVTETIELHKTMLREQSVLIAKELIATLASEIETATVKNIIRNKMQWVIYAFCFIGGVLLSAGIFKWFRFFCG